MLGTFEWILKLALRDDAGATILMVLLPLASYRSLMVTQKSFEVVRLGFPIPMFIVDKVWGKLLCQCMGTANGSLGKWFAREMFR